MNVLKGSDLLAVNGGVVKPDSEAYKVGQVVGDIIREGGEILGFIGGLMMVGTLGLFGAGS